MKRISSYNHFDLQSLYRLILGLMVGASAMASSQAAVVSFGSGDNAFNIEFVTIGNPGNGPDTTGLPSIAGSVGYIYGIGKFEVSEDMITKFNNSQSLQITQNNRGPNKPATSVSWNEAARFVNWLNTITGHAAAYKFTTAGFNDDITLWTTADLLDYDPSNPYRSKRAKYALQSYNEWYKAAYYSPNDSTYYDFPNGSNSAPLPVASGTAANTAVFGGHAEPADFTLAGGLSPYGVMGLGGNVREWEESSVDLTNSMSSLFRGVRGGARNDSFDRLSSSMRQLYNPPNAEFNGLGFRVVTLPDPAVPEPSSMVIGTMLGLFGMLAKRRGISRPPGPSHLPSALTRSDNLSRKRSS